mmetsp:Transcript_44011/g.53958  ORF Transcript_44011/g.53958 Transcript_44011/m.53958 type:complete len:132 (+) Transcript_44011:138-533(+)|eukprot:CAMPEP_0114672440 /NCGR_PEP_ID=MMETSP0191-20121206/42918_1 /TAXON_ID=126664 /ORGANISM="Sorites sp." /LENGTH=131 /DNA_ID=CAMNT_0001934801 /DNA_START=115 /DNA_END=510 /DNA_ORIENTATION=+
MKELACYLLAKQGGIDKPSKDDIKKILDSVGITADDAKLDALFTDLGKFGDQKLDDVIKEGMEQLAVIPSGGGGGAPADAGGAAPGGDDAKAPEPESESEQESSKAAGDLFGGGGGDSSSEEEESDDDDSD